MRKLIFVFMVVGFAFILSANRSNVYAQDGSGGIGGGTSELIVPQDSPENGGFCIDFDFRGKPFTLVVNPSRGHAHTSNTWCQDWNPEGTVTVKRKRAKNRKIVIFNLSGTVASETCCDDMLIEGRIVYKLRQNKLLRAKVVWRFPGCSPGPFEFNDKVKNGTLRDCR